MPITNEDMPPLAFPDINLPPQDSGINRRSGHKRLSEVNYQQEIENAINRALERELREQESFLLDNLVPTEEEWVALAIHAQGDIKMPIVIDTPEHDITIRLDIPRTYADPMTLLEFEE